MSGSSLLGIIKRIVKDYVLRCMDTCGLTTCSTEMATLRKERDHPVPVMVVRARKNAPPMQSP